MSRAGSSANILEEMQETRRNVNTPRLRLRRTILRKRDVSAHQRIERGVASDRPHDFLRAGSVRRWTPRALTSTGSQIIRFALYTIVFQSLPCKWPFLELSIASADSCLAH